MGGARALLAALQADQGSVLREYDTAVEKDSNSAVAFLRRARARVMVSQNPQQFMLAVGDLDTAIELADK